MSRMDRWEGSMAERTRRAIIAEDNSILRELIAKALEWSGPWEIVKTIDGAEVLSALASGRKTDLVILDWKMEGLDGLECARRIRQGEKGIDRTIPLVLVTSAGEELTEDMIREAGVTLLLRKPFTLIKLQSAIRQIIP
ncbi:CheY-like receiver [Pararhodospirillum photometricum DSM 122]|uniref:CheY-like receiver n=2 Tax=Pararhodospirillum photometricum TaxID=1084 RepID=H6SIP0_PARPM|nr:CheY-like receiver [Pararhodospirillum photometricum DSM 122]